MIAIVLDISTGVRIGTPSKVFVVAAIVKRRRSGRSSDYGKVRLVCRSDPS